MITTKYFKKKTQKKNNNCIFFKKLKLDKKYKVPEYWIVDYLGIGAKRFTGNPKQPTLSICQLIDDEYQITPFRGDNRISSLSFTELDLTYKQILIGQY